MAKYSPIEEGCALLNPAAIPAVGSGRRTLAAEVMLAVACSFSLASLRMDSVALGFTEGFYSLFAAPCLTATMQEGAFVGSGAYEWRVGIDLKGGLLRTYVVRHCIPAMSARIAGARRWSSG